MIAYKAFDKDLSCRGYKFKEDAINETAEANCRKNGFHCAENPIDCLTYYSDWDNTVYYTVEVGGDINEDDMDSKISCTKLKLLKKLTVEDFVLEGLKYMFVHPFRKWNNNVKKDEVKTNKAFAFVRGKNPLACGEIGSVIGMIKENPSNSDVISINLLKVDGVKIMPNIWYNITGEAVGREFEDEKGNFGEAA